MCSDLVKDRSGTGCWFLHLDVDILKFTYMLNKKREMDFQIKQSQFYIPHWLGNMWLIVLDLRKEQQQGMQSAFRREMGQNWNPLNLLSFCKWRLHNSQS